MWGEHDSIMSESEQENVKQNDYDVADVDIAACVANLSASSRRDRQHAAAILAQQTREDAACVLPYGNELIDALNRPEACTRWECLDALTELVPHDSRLCDKALHGAEVALFDEESGLVRLSAMRFLCHLGATTEKRSEKTWPLIDEGIQCYHGDPEFSKMLAAVAEFAQGKLSPSVRESLIDRMSFDAKNSKGSLKRRAAQIIEYATQ